MDTAPRGPGNRVGRRQGKPDVNVEIDAEVQIHPAQNAEIDIHLPPKRMPAQTQDGWHIHPLHSSQRAGPRRCPPDDPEPRDL
jgi:hypothetical protein